MYKKIVLLLLAAALLLGVSGCKKAEDNHITIGVMPSENILPLVYAAENGIFEKYGLDVDVQVFKSAVDRDTAFQTGNLDGMASDMISAVFLTDAGFDVCITAEDITNFKVISVLSDKNKPARTMGVSKSTVIEYIADQFISAQNETYELTYVPAVPVRLELLNNKELDFATLPEPLASVPKDSTVVATSNDMQLYPGVHLFSRDAAKNKNLSNFYKAYNEAVLAINGSNAMAFSSILMDTIGFSETSLNDYTLPVYSPAKASNAADFDAVMAWMNEKGYSESHYGLSDLSDFSFIK